MKKISVYLSLFIVSLFSISCTLVDHQIEPGPDVYITGVEESNGLFTGQYWKNGKSVRLLTSPTLVYPTAIAVSGNDVHVVGWVNDQKSQAVGVHWKNGKLVDFAKLRPSFLSDVAVSGNDVYIAGQGVDHANYSYATYWKNGEAVTLENSIGGWARAVLPSGSDIYAAGSFWNGTVTVATYWKNGKSFKLTDGTKPAIANAIAVLGDDVYVVGIESNMVGNENAGSIQIAKCWKNGVEIPLTDGKNYSEANDITIVGNDVYIAGKEDIGTLNVAKYWKNGKPIALNGGLVGVGISAFNNDIYIVGGTYIGSNGVGLYWKNEQPVYLTDVSKNSYLSSILVKNP